MFFSSVKCLIFTSEWIFMPGYTCHFFFVYTTIKHNFWSIQTPKLFLFNFPLRARIFLFFLFFGGISFYHFWEIWFVMVGLVRSTCRSQVWPNGPGAYRTPRSESRSQRYEISPSDRRVHPHHRRRGWNLLHPSGETTRSLSIITFFFSDPVDGSVQSLVLPKLIWLVILLS